MTSRYIGFILPEELSIQIELARKPLIDNSTLQPLTPHITVITPPMMRAVSVVDAEEALQELAPKYTSITATIKPAATFSHQVAYLGIDAPDLHVLQASLMHELSIKQFALATKATTYTPHITLLQARYGKKLSDEKVRALKASQFPASTKLTELVLFESPGKRNYQEICRISLS